MENYSERLRSALRLFDEADAYLILAGAGAAYEGGLESYGALLYEKFSDLAQKGLARVPQKAEKSKNSL